MAEVDSQSVLSNAFFGVLAAACAEVTQGARWAQAARRACRAVQQDTSTRGNAKLTSARQCELNKFICTMYWHCCKLNEQWPCSPVTCA